jgi:biotin-[acetyl-CoA-carboxylase] ligase BirA-like protein
VDEFIGIERFPVLDSTSLHARRLAEAGRLCTDHPVALVADVQTGGRGRLGRAWSSPPGGLWMTLCWPVAPARLGPLVDGLGLRVGVACRRGVAGAVCESAPGLAPGVDVLLKWPNDVLVGGRKVLGVLTEVLERPGWSGVLVGVGVNVNVDPAALPAVDGPIGPGSLHALLGRRLEIAAVRGRLLGALASTIPLAGLSRGLIAEAAEHLAGVGKPALVSRPDGTKVAATLVGLDDRGQGVFEIDGRRFVPPG